MQFTYHPQAKDKTLKIDGDLHKYLFKIRRENSDENLYFRNLEDKNLYEYKVISINRRDTILELINIKEEAIEPSKYLHIGWCIIDPKNIEKMIPSLNEIGVSKITFIRCQYSQSKYKINYDKLTKLLQNSSGQCGRSSIIELSEIDSFDKFLKLYPDSFMFNFSENNIENHKNTIDTIIIGCEGGFSNKETEKFSKDKIIGCNSNMILKSETAVVSTASMILL